jgi:hypothetical protein
MIKQITYNPSIKREGGILESWMIVPLVSDDSVVIGRVFGDPVWPSGVAIRTSIVQKIEGNKLYTLNTVYRLGNNFKANYTK